MEELPKSLTVLGGGYIGVELAQIMTAFGVDTTLVTRRELLRGHVDQELIPVLLDSMEKYGTKAMLNSPFNSVENINGGGFHINLASGEKLKSEAVLAALGRPPNLDGLNLSAAGVEVENRAVKIDDYSKTNVPGVYAIGDAVNKVNLTPVALRQGRILAEHLFNDKPNLKMSFVNIATVIFSHPPIGTVGLTQDKAESLFGAENVTIHKSTFINMFYSPCQTQELKHKTMFKMVCRRVDGVEKVIGLHAIGRNVDEMMQTASVAITMGATKQDFDNSVAIHPTASEELVTMDGNYIF